MAKKRVDIYTTKLLLSTLSINVFKHFSENYYFSIETTIKKFDSSVASLLMMLYNGHRVAFTTHKHKNCYQLLFYWVISIIFDSIEFEFCLLIPFYFSVSVRTKRNVQRKTKWEFQAIYAQLIECCDCWKMCAKEEICTFPFLHWHKFWAVQPILVT